MKKIKFKNYIEDILIVLGLFLIAFATFILNIVAGIYVLGLILFCLGIFFAKYPIKKKGGD